MSAVAELRQSNRWDWQQVVTNTVNDLSSLSRYIDVPEQQLDDRARSNAFAMRIPLPFVSRMRRGDIDDPLLRQVLPERQEMQIVRGLQEDPLQEAHFAVRPGLIHKYEGRVLLTAAASCPINCRYCFRRHFPYAENRLTPSQWQSALDYIASDNSIREVILSGGEPLLLKDSLLNTLLTEIEHIPHVELVRIHTRMPVAVPQRLTHALCQRLIDSRCKMTVVLHCNHPNEIDEHVQMHISPLVNSAVTVLNQSVLLRGINDNTDTLVQLSERLFDSGIMPYYLHATDPVIGAGHFIVADDHAQALAQELTHRLPGYLVPTLVREEPGKAAKTRLPLGPSVYLA